MNEKTKDVICPVCLSNFTAKRPNNKYCSSSCRVRGWLMDNREKWNQYSRKRWADSGTGARLRLSVSRYQQKNRERINGRNRIRYQNDSHYRFHLRQLHRQYYQKKMVTDPLYFAIKDSKRRAALRSRAVDGIDTSAILLDGGLFCSLCFGFVEPRQISIDHKIPLIRGGSHTQDNLQLTHLRCNLMKGAL